MHPHASLSRKFLARQNLDIAIVNLAKEAGTGSLVDIYLLRPRRDPRQLLLLLTSCYFREFQPSGRNFFFLLVTSARGGLDSLAPRCSNEKRQRR